MLSAISVSTGCYITWQPPDSEPWGTRDGAKLPAAKPTGQSAAADTPGGVPEMQDEKTEDAGPRGAYQRGKFSEPRLLPSFT